MKKYFSFFGNILLMNTCLFAQNVGIGDPLPSAKLTIAGSETTPNGQAASLKIINIASTNAWYLRAGATGTNTPANGFSIGDNANIHFNLLSNGNLGLGLIPQSARLHVNGPIKIEGSNIFEFGAGIAGKELNAGKIGYNAFGSNALEIVGAGTNSTNRRVFFFAEGGTHFSGPVNVASNLNTVGQLQLNGNPGIDGQVLTSNGASAPAWQDQAYSNNVRFGVQLEHSGSSTNDSLRIAYISYNLSPSDISTVIGTRSITINRSGLYHFDIASDAYVVYSTAPTSYPRLTLRFFCGYPQPFDLIRYRVMDTYDAAKTGWSLDGSSSIDVYINAPATICILRLITISAPPPRTANDFNGYLTGYLIKE